MSTLAIGLSGKIFHRLLVARLYVDTPLSCIVNCGLGTLINVLDVCLCLPSLTMIYMDAAARDTETEKQQSLMRHPKERHSLDDGDR